MARAWYTTREEVKTALDFKQGAAANTLIDQKIASACDLIDGKLHRSFYPYLGTRSFDWPNIQTAWPWRLWLDEDEMCAAPTAMVSGGVAIPLANIIPYPNAAPQRQLPYTRLELNVASNSQFSATSTWQNTTLVTSTYGHSDVQIPAGQLPAPMGATDSTVTVGVSGPRGVGSILLIDAERLLVTERRSASTGTTLQANMAANNAVNLLQVTDTTQYGLYETLTIDGEQMYVYDTVGTNLLVKRAWNGSPLAAHTAGATIYAQRLLTVTRGALGTAAATHLINAPITEHDAPGLIRQLSNAVAIVSLIQTRAGYPAVKGRSSGAGGQTAALTTLPSDLDSLWSDAMDAFGRKARIRSA